MPPRSMFVTVLAWTTIIPAAFGVLIAGVQNLFFNLFMSPADLERMVAMLGPGMGGITQITFGNLRLLLLLFLATSVLFLVTGVGLLKRRNWARVLLVATLALGTLYSIFTALFVDSSADLAAMLAPSASFDGETVDFSGVASIMRATSITLLIVFTAFNAWLVWRLYSQPIAREFCGAPETNR